MKKKKGIDALVPWTPFERSSYSPEAMEQLDATGQKIRMSFINSRYQVDLEQFTHPTLGDIVKVGIKDHQRTARHDWRDFQRIKNELIGEQFDAIELYPAEDRLVDTSNQYYLFVFLEVRVPLGWNARLVSEGVLKGTNHRQRPWDPDVRPPDVTTADAIQAHINKLVEERRQHGTGGMAAPGGSGPGPSDHEK